MELCNWFHNNSCVVHLLAGRKQERLRCGQAMVEAIIVLIVLVGTFLCIFQLADNLRAKMLLEYAAQRAARAAAVGMNEFMVLKVARVATLPAAGSCLTSYSGGSDDKPISDVQAISRMPEYLCTEYDAAAEVVLNYSFWQNGKTTVRNLRSTNDSRCEMEVVQHRKQFFNMAQWFSPNNGEANQSDDEVVIAGRAEIESHCADWLE